MNNFILTNHFPPEIYYTENGHFAIACESIINPDDVVFWSGNDWSHERAAKVFEDEKEVNEYLKKIFPAN